MVTRGAGDSSVAISTTFSSDMATLLGKSDILCCLQCFDTVGWAAGRASGL